MSDSYPQAPPSMRLAEILSDLVSLRVCDPSAALALVSARPGPASATQTLDAQGQGTTGADADTKRDTDGDDAELTRAKELVRLHTEVKLAHGRGS